MIALPLEARADNLPIETSPSRETTVSATFARIKVAIVRPDVAFAGEAAHGTVKELSVLAGARRVKDV